MISYRFVAVCCCSYISDMLIDIAWNFLWIAWYLDVKIWIGWEHKIESMQKGNLLKQWIRERIRNRNECDDDVDDGDSEHFEKIIYTPAKRCIICLEYIAWDEIRRDETTTEICLRNEIEAINEGIWHEERNNKSRNNTPKLAMQTKWWRKCHKMCVVYCILNENNRTAQCK